MKTIAAAFIFLILGLGLLRAEDPGQPTTIRIYVSGEIEKTGKYDVPVKMAFIDAILSAGGPKATANLRNIQILRPTVSEKNEVTLKPVGTVDYKMIITGKASGPDLKDGDYILITARTERVNF